MLLAPHRHRHRRKGKHTRFVQQSVQRVQGDLDLAAVPLRHTSAQRKRLRENRAQRQRPKRLSATDHQMDHFMHRSNRPHSILLKPNVPVCARVQTMREYAR